MFVSGFVIAYQASWKLSLAMTSMVPCIALTGALLARFTTAFKTRQLAETSKGANVAEEVISSVRTVHAFSTQERLVAVYDQFNDRAAQLGDKLATLHAASLGIFMFVIYASYGLAFFFGAKLLTSGDINAGTIITVIFSILVGAFSLAQIPPNAQAVSYAMGAAASLYATIDRVPSIDAASTDGLTPDKIEGALEAHSIEFYYPSRPSVRVLHEYSVKFEPGKTTALVGASGAGKSSLIGIVERFYDVTAGKFTLDGHDIRDLNLRWLRAQIGLVSQEPTLFSGTVFSNIALGLLGTRYEDVSDDEKTKLVHEAAVQANADTFVRALPDGYDTQVGERAMLLSGGQKQRIAIARAIVGKPSILLLDEATSALDSASEAIVQDALDKASQGRTTVVIAHRLSTIRGADKIVVMAHGEVLEIGKHDELMARNGAYAKLVAAQRYTADDEVRVEDLATAYDAVDEKGRGQFARQSSFSGSDEKRGMLQRSTTGRSAASAALSGKEGLATHSGKNHSFFELFRRMGRINKDEWPLYGVGFIGAIVCGMIYPVYAIVFGGAIQTFSLVDPNQLRTDANRYALYAFIISIVAAVGQLLKDGAFGWTSERLGRKLRHATFANILKQDISFFDEASRSTGALTAEVTDLTTKILGLAGTTLGVLVQSVATIVGGLIIGLIYAPKVSAVAMALIPFTLSTGIVRLRVVMVKDKVNKLAHEQSAQQACEAASAIRTVASLGREDDVLRMYSKLLDEPERIALKSAIWSNLVYGLSQAMIFFVLPLIFWYGSRQIVDDGLSIRNFYVGLMSVLFGSMQAGQMFAFAPDMSSARGAAAAFVDLADSEPLIDVRPEAEGVSGENIEGAIAFKDVHFRYLARPHVPVLRGLDLEIKPGSFVALTGQSGCGKSTIIQLVQRFYDVLSGSVEIDGRPIQSYNLRSLRGRIALVSQEPTLYAGTLAENISLGCEREVTQEEIEQAAREANIHDFIISLPDGYQTLAGAKGTQLSGGQKQRVAIARAIIRRAKILLLDEATSALDSESERVVQKALDVAATGRTTIAVAHRLSTIQHADTIFFLERGRIVERGSWAQLMAARGSFYDLAMQQTLEKAK